MNLKSHQTGRAWPFDHFLIRPMINAPFENLVKQGKKKGYMKTMKGRIQHDAQQESKSFHTFLGPRIQVFPPGWQNHKCHKFPGTPGSGGSSSMQVVQGGGKYLDAQCYVRHCFGGVARLRNDRWQHFTGYCRQDQEGTKFWGCLIFCRRLEPCFCSCSFILNDLSLCIYCMFYMCIYIWLSSVWQALGCTGWTVVISWWLVKCVWGR